MKVCFSFSHCLNPYKIETLILFLTYTNDKVTCKNYYLYLAILQKPHRSDATGDLFDAFNQQH